MKIPAKALAVAVCATLAVSCCPCRSYQKRTRRPLLDTEWQLVQLGGEQLHAAAGTYTLRLSAGEERLTGTGSCNTLSGSYRVAKDRSLHLGPIASTRRDCADRDREHRFIEALERTTHYDMDGPLLLLLADGELRAILRALPASGE